LIFLLSVFFQQVQGYSAWQTGLRLLPLSVINIVGTTLSGQLIGRIGPRIPIMGGLALSAGGIFAFLGCTDSASYVLLVLCFLAIGFGAALTMPALTAAHVGAVGREQAGIASGVLNASRQAGSTFGVAILGSLFFTNISGHAARNGIHITLGVAGVGMLVGCVITFLSVPSSVAQPPTTQEKESVEEV
jgi:DHA2 family methylenomycin A resistance protein-like MFS transporter